MPPTSPSTNSEASHQLSQNDVARLLNPEKATEARLDITQKLVQSYEGSPMSEEASMVAEQIFRLLVRDTELEVRKKMSAHLKASDILPRDIAMTMANDVAEVALPVLEFSKVLTEKDLMDIVEATPDAQRHVAIAKRENVSKLLVETLLENTDEVEVAQTLAGNDGADLNQKSIEILVARHRRLPQVMDILATRPNLPPTVKEKVISKVSDDLKKALSSQHETAKDIVRKEASQSREEATLELISGDLSEEEARQLVEQLQTFDRMTPSLLFASVVRGYINFYVVAMSTLAGVSLENALKLLKDRGGLGFKGIYNKSGLDAKYYTVLRDVTPSAIELKDRFAALEGEPFAKSLTKHIVKELQQEEKSADHIVTAIKESLAA